MTSLTFILCNLCPRHYICIHEVWLTIRRVYYIRYCLSILNILSQLVMKIKNQTMGNDEIQKPLHPLNKYSVGQLGLILTIRSNSFFSILNIFFWLTYEEWLNKTD